MSSSLSVAALPPLPSAALDARAQSEAQHRSDTADDSGDGDEDDASLNGLWAALVDDLLQEIHLDLCVQLHKEARTKGWTPSVAETLTRSDRRFATSPSTRALAARSFWGCFALRTCRLRAGTDCTALHAISPALMLYLLSFVTAGTQSCSCSCCARSIRAAPPNAQARRANLPLPVVWT
jgi:hypothetical protein